MIIKCFDKDMTFLTTLSNYREAIITQELQTGYKTLQLLIPYSLGLLQEEQKIELDNYLYVIKEVNTNNNDYYQVYCKPYFSDLLSKSIDHLTGYNMVLDDCLRTVFEGTEWTYKIEGLIAGSYTISIQNKTVLEALVSLKQLYQFSYFFDTKNKIVTFWKNKQNIAAVLAIDSNNLRNCISQSNTYNLVTRLIPIGKDGATIHRVNNNSPWVEDFSYTDEIITGYWVSSSTKNIADLLTLAQAKIADLAKPQVSYKIKLTELNETIQVGDSLHVIDKIKNINAIVQVQKVIKYLNNSDQSYLEAGALLPSFDNIYKDFKDAQKNVNENMLQNLTELNLR